jgi:propionyl-CoA synthetase
VRDTGGTVVALNWAMKHIFDIGKGDTYFAGSDIGWVVGHSFIMYGPLIRGATSVFFEGKPIIPNPGVLWRIVQQYKVKALYIAPTAVRIIKKEDYEGEHVKNYNVTSLKSFHLVGERCDPDTIWWVHHHFPSVFINDSWWQTETGWPCSANYINTQHFKHVYPTLPGSVTKPVPGYDIRIFDEQNQEVSKPNELGKVVIKLPMPPSFMLTLWGHDEAFRAKYLADTPGYYTTGDAGLLDEHGYLHIMTRMDDVINTCGHRLSTGRMEEVINDHPSVVESAVVGHNDEIRGDCPLAYVILKGNSD